MCRLWQTQIRFGSKWSKTQLPLVMIYTLYYDDYNQSNDNPSMGIVLFDSMNWIGI